MNLCEMLVINLKCYHKKYNLSQEKIAEVLGTTLSYLNKIEPEYLVNYSMEHLTNNSIIDKKKKN